MASVKDKHAVQVSVDDITPEMVQGNIAKSNVFMSAATMQGIALLYHV